MTDELVKEEANAIRVTTMAAWKLLIRGISFVTAEKAHSNSSITVIMPSLDAKTIHVASYLLVKLF